MKAMIEGTKQRDEHERDKHPSRVEMVTAFFDAYRAHDVERMVELCADNADFHYVPFEVWGKQRVIRGDGKVRAIGKVIWRTLIDSFPNLTNEVTSITSDDEGNVAVEVVISGTQAKPFSSIGNQGLPLRLTACLLVSCWEGRPDRGNNRLLGYSRLAAPAWLARGGLVDDREMNELTQ